MGLEVKKIDYKKFINDRENVNFMQMSTFKILEILLNGLSPVVSTLLLISAILSDVFLPKPTTNYSSYIAKSVMQ